MNDASDNLKENPTLTDTLLWSSNALASAGIPTPKLDAEIIISHVLKTKRTLLYLTKEKVLDSGTRRLIREFTVKRAKRIPMAYILGEWDFMGLTFKINESVITPRPATETLVEECLLIIKKLQSSKNKGLNIADMGTGSGCIAISLGKLFNNLNIIAIDISKNAVSLAKANAVMHNVSKKINIICSDLLNAFRNAQSLDLILANLPYIQRSKFAKLSPEVCGEPKEALISGSDGLFHITKLIRQSKLALKHKGYILLEIGYDQAKAVSNILKTNGFGNIEVKKDLEGFDRVIIAKQRR